jgi:hypothetical protein
VTEALTELDRASAGGMGQNIAALVNLAAAVRAARTMAPPVPGVTVNAGHVVRAVITAGGRDTAWFVAAEDTERGQWVTWRAETFPSGDRAGQLAYSGGHYFWASDARQQALANLADRAGLLPAIAPLIAAEMTRYEHRTTAEDRRAAARLRRWATT